MTIGSTASNADRVGLQLLKQGAPLTKPGATRIVPAPDVAYGLDPELSRPLCPDPRRARQMPSPSTIECWPALESFSRSPAANFSRHRREEIASSALNYS